MLSSKIDFLFYDCKSIYTEAYSIFFKYRELSLKSQILE